MKLLLFLIPLFTLNISSAQTFSVKSITLPPELSYYDNQFSGLYIHEQQLFLMSESRLQDSAEAKIYAINLADADASMADTNYKLPYKKYPIINLQLLRDRMYELGDDYEGLEAIVINGQDVYLTVETATPSNNCYLLKGQLTDTAVILDLKVLIPLPKPITNNNKHIYNAGYEAMAIIDNTIFAFFEYNFFKEKNIVLGVTPITYRDVMVQLADIEKIPFRLTDITKTGKNTFTAINYFYKGGGEDEVYRVDKTDKVNDKLIRDGFGYKSYCRLIELTYKKNKFTWKPIAQLPYEYMAYNWEGIAAYKNGYFLINDKYTPARPYKSTLLYLMPIK